jgi:hypothetical protein
MNVTGVLSLKSLDYVNIRNDDMVRAVGAICPYLDRVVMVDADLGKVISSSDLKSYLPTHWPKVLYYLFYLNEFFNNYFRFFSDPAFNTKPGHT